MKSTAYWIFNMTAQSTKLQFNKKLWNLFLSIRNGLNNKYKQVSSKVVYTKIIFNRISSKHKKVLQGSHFTKN